MWALPKAAGGWWRRTATRRLRRVTTAEGRQYETRTRRQWRHVIVREPRQRIALREPANDVETEFVTEDRE